jgi:hypothetical protein
MVIVRNVRRAPAPAAAQIGDAAQALLAFSMDPM